MDVDQRHPDPLEKVPRQDLHVAGEHDQVALAVEQLEQLRLGLGLAVPLDRHVVVGQAEPLDRLAQVADGWTQQTRSRRRARRGASATAAPAGSGRSARRGSRSVSAWRRPTAARSSRTAPRREAEALREARSAPRWASVNSIRRKNVPPSGIGRVLVRADDVRARLVQEADDRGDDPGPVRAGDQQAHHHSRLRGLPGRVCLRGGSGSTPRPGGGGHQWLTAAAASSDTSRSS